MEGRTDFIQHFDEYYDSQEVVRLKVSVLVLFQILLIRLAQKTGSVVNESQPKGDLSHVQLAPYLPVVFDLETPSVLLLPL